MKCAQTAVVIGGGPAGLMAAEMLVQGGMHVALYDAMPSVGRKFLLAGKGGLNITHSEPREPFLSRYGTRRADIEPLLEAFGPDALCDWIHGLGVQTFVGSSGRVFPREMKAAPLLRAWLHRLRSAGVAIHVRHRWHGWDQSGRLCFTGPEGDIAVQADVVVLALGGGSWARLGSDGAWVTVLQKLGIEVAPLRPANCGFDVDWSEHFSTRFAGQPLKSVALEWADSAGQSAPRRGEFVVTATGIEGSLIYALSAGIRDEIATHGVATRHLDLMPDKSLAQVTEALSRPRGADSMANHLRRKLGLEGVKAGLLRELVSKADFAVPALLAAAIKALPLRLVAPRPLDEAISSAGGVLFESLDSNLMLRKQPGVFCAGEMLDWEAPTGGYLLTACFASGRAAGLGALEWLKSRPITPVD
ncbi:MAG: TIGR03862 family flavoprotein [Formivibrio sp.]|nr:TIGR03862 family flavoprotein [Formivibrio sp.]